MANGIEFRLFVSSTFADTTAERNALRRHLLPAKISHEFGAKCSVSQKRVTRGHIQSFCEHVRQISNA